MFWKKVSKEAPKSTLEVLNERSGNAVKVITDTINDLRSTNEAIEAEKTDIAAKITVLETESKDLTILSAQNARIVSNFEKLLK